VRRVFVAAADPATRDVLSARARAGEIDVVLAGHAADVAQTNGERPAVLLLTDDVEGSVRALARQDLPAWGVLPAGANPADVAAAIEAVARGLVVVPAAAMRQGRPVRASGREEEAGAGALTAREHEVLVLASDGLSNREIGSALGISDHTVKFHLASIYAKLGASTRTEAVQRGLRSGLIEL
jgi:DNA-binding NarL/FixJ family response regulator